MAGERQIEPAKAEIVRRVFREFAAGKSPRQIAIGLNHDSIPAPGGEGWGQSTINGNPKRATGILNNELYIGRLVWNRLHYVKDPAIGKRVSRPNEPDKLIIKDAPELRIVDDDLWQAVKARQADASKRAFPKTAPSRNNDTPAAKTGFWSNQRPKHLLTGLMRCGVCGGGYHKISATLFGCAAARNKGTCDNRTKDEAFSIIRTLIEEVRLVPENGELRVEIRGALAGILALSAPNNKTARVGTDGSVSVLLSQIKLVAGARYHLYRTRLIALSRR